MPNHKRAHFPVRSVLSGSVREPDQICCWPSCYTEIGPIAAPLCQRHLIKAYRIYRTSHLWAADDMAESAMERLVHAVNVPSDPRPEQGLVYFIRHGDRIKIGWTSNLKQRMANLPHDEILGTVPGTMADEKRCHHAFAHLRANGREWFREIGRAHV